ncbi:MAG: fumarylacetoacetate hydrolase family, partial [Mycobacterium sp.]|nr:fumarylacetoacetate hydrolase family [Mycobacterium sp.]
MEHLVRLMNMNGRLHVRTPGGAVDVSKASDGLFAPDPQAIYDCWDSFEAWCRAMQFELTTMPAVAIEPAELGSP